MRRLLFLSISCLAGIGLSVYLFQNKSAVNNLPALDYDWNKSSVKMIPNPSVSEQAFFKKYPIKRVPGQIASVGREEPVLNKAEFQQLDPLSNSAFGQWVNEPEFHQVKNIRPPIKGVNPPASATVISSVLAEQGGIVNLGSGAFLHLPENALIDEAGNPINEPVKISYCQLSNPIDVYLSGIPMKYDSAGTTETFRTAGMVRLEASTFSGRKVKLKEGKNMRLDMPTVDESDDYNFYTFDEDAGAWVYDKPAPPSQPAIDLVLDTANFIYDFDVRTFDSKFEDFDYHFVVNNQTIRDKFWSTSQERFYNRSENIIRKALYGTRFKSFNYIKLRPYVQIIGYDETHKAIKELRFRVMAISNGAAYFRELRHFYSSSFVIEDAQNLQEFYKKYVRGRHFNDIRIEYEKGEEYCTLILKDDNELVKIKTRLSSGPQKDVPLITKVRFYLSYNRYLRDLHKKQEAHDRVVLKRKRESYQMSNRSRVYFAGPGQQYRSLQLPGFATYNCDQIARMVNPQPIASHFENEQHKKLHADNLVVCDTRARATFYFYPNVIPNCSKNGLGFALLTEGDTTYYLNRKEWIPGQSTCTMKLLPDIKNGEELRQLLIN